MYANNHALNVLFFYSHFHELDVTLLTQECFPLPYTLGPTCLGVYPLPYVAPGYAYTLPYVYALPPCIVWTSCHHVRYIYMLYLHVRCGHHATM